MCSLVRVIFKLHHRLELRQGVAVVTLAVFGQGLHSLTDVSHFPLQAFQFFFYILYFFLHSLEFLRGYESPAKERSGRHSVEFRGSEERNQPSLPGVEPQSLRFGKGDTGHVTELPSPALVSQAS